MFNVTEAKRRFKKSVKHILLANTVNSRLSAGGLTALRINRGHFGIVISKSISHFIHIQYYIFLFNFFFRVIL